MGRISRGGAVGVDCGVGVMVGGGKVWVGGAVGVFVGVGALAVRVPWSAAARTVLVGA